MNDSDEFYVGYLPAAPRGVARWVRRTVLALAGLLGALALALPLLQGAFEPGIFELGRTTPFEGTIHTRPYPVLATTDGAFPLVAPGKHGADRLVAAHDGARTTVQAFRIVAPAATLLEVEAEPAPGAPSAPRAASRGLGEQVLRGVIVDSKCAAGVMRPGRGKPHRGCAARCISGGVPPMLLVEPQDAAPRLLLLVGGDGRPLGRDVLPYVDELVEVRGAVSEREGWLYLAAEPGGYLRVNGG